MKIGYQLYSALPLCQGAENLKHVIGKIAAMGYDGVEFCSYEGIPAAEMKAFLAKHQIEAVNSHVQLERWDADAEGEIRYAAEAGIPWVTIPWMAPELRNGEGYKKVREMIPELIRICNKYGVGLLYHNHDFEFDAYEEQYVLDAILDADPELGLELDTFWAYFADVEPVAYMKAKKDQLVMIHIKDYESYTGGATDGGQEIPAFSALGTGKMDLQPVLAGAEALGLAWVVVEQDNSKIDVLESAKISVDYLKGIIERT